MVLNEKVDLIREHPAKVVDWLCIIFSIGLLPHSIIDIVHLLHHVLVVVMHHFVD